ncbi:hypothetical protein FA15DRAFT_653761 [Coprinopsis marcescibilis]|uniref:Secreted protein n=1 Tax=Coprinopsis marcescibilis TaxID=230819 RepID=A0A5C3L2R2_COPMA|nr:hypothetical protein FA15DRAFT_653761 [Coprinopsis marcescibilis]
MLVRLWVTLLALGDGITSDLIQCVLTQMGGILVRNSRLGLREKFCLLKTSLRLLKTEDACLWICQGTLWGFGTVPIRDGARRCRKRKSAAGGELGIEFTPSLYLLLEQTNSTLGFNNIPVQEYDVTSL